MGVNWRAVWCCRKTSTSSTNAKHYQTASKRHRREVNFHPADNLRRCRRCTGVRQCATDRGQGSDSVSAPNYTQQGPRELKTWVQTHSLAVSTTPHVRFLKLYIHADRLCGACPHTYKRRCAAMVVSSSSTAPRLESGRLTPTGMKVDVGSLKPAGRSKADTPHATYPRAKETTVDI